MGGDILKEARGSPSEPLKNQKHELFVVNLVGGMSRAEAYSEAGYSPKNETQARKLAYQLIETNRDVSDRYNFLIEKHNRELEEKGIISRERMIQKALYAMNCALGELPVKRSAKHSYGYKLSADNYDKLEDRDKEKVPEGAEEIQINHQDWTVEEVHEHDLKAFAPIWKELMQVLDYYPKENDKEVLEIPEYIGDDELED